MVGVIISSDNNNDEVTSTDKILDYSQKVSVQSSEPSAKNDSGFLKHFEDFFKFIKKKTTKEPTPPSADINLSAAVKSLIQDTCTKTAIVGPRNVGKSHLLNTLLESTAPFEKEYQEQRDAALFAQAAYKKQTAYGFSTKSEEAPLPIESTSVYKNGYSFQVSNQASKYCSKTAFNFDDETSALSQKIYALKTGYDFDDKKTDVSEDVSYTEATGYSFDETNEVSSEDASEFQWEIGKIEQTLVPDASYQSTIDWNKERTTNMTQFTVDDIRSFVLPQGSRALANHCYEIRYGKIPELIVTFVDETKLRHELWEVHEVEAGSRPLYNLAYKQLLESRYRSVLGLKQDQKIPLGHIHSPAHFKIPSDIQKLLGKSFRFRGLGQDFNLDRIYVREKLREVVQNYTYYASNLLLRLPCGILEGNREISEVSNIDFATPKSSQIIGNANLLLVVLDKRGLLPEISDVLRSSGFLEKSIRSPDQHRAVFVQLIEPSDRRLNHQLNDAKLKSDFEGFKHSAILQYKLLLSQHTVNWAAVDRIVNATTVLAIRPRLYSLLHLANRGEAATDANAAKHLEALSTTGVPAIAGCIANMSLAQCSESLREMNREWMKQVTGHHPVTPSPAPEDEHDVAHRLDQLTSSVSDKFEKLRLDLLDKIESMDSVLVPKAKESYEACRPRGAQAGNALLATYIDKLMSGPLTEAAPQVWNENIVQQVPKKLEGLLRHAEVVLRECVNLVEKQEEGMEKNRVKTLVMFCQGTHERAMRRYDEFRRQLELDTLPMIKNACADAVQSKLQKSENPSITQNYQELVSTTLPEISMEAAKNIKEKFSQKLRTDMKHLEMMEKDFERALKSIMVVLKAKPTTNHALKNDIGQQIMQLTTEVAGQQAVNNAATWNSIINPKKVEDPKISDFSDVIYKKPAHHDIINNNNNIAVFTAFDDVETLRVFSSKNAWSQLDKREPQWKSNKMDEMLKKAGLVPVDVRVDSACQFRALAHQVYGTEDAHPIVRLLIMSEMLANPSVYERFVTMKGMQLQEYVARVSREQECGDHLTLCAFANFYGGDLLIYSPMFSNPLLLQSRNGHNSRLFCISYIDENRYQSLIKEKSSNEKERLTVTPMDITVPQPEKKAPKQKPSGIRWYQLTGIINLNLQAEKLGRTDVTLQKQFSPLSLSDLCLIRITASIDMMPCLDGSLPEELTQKLVKQLISHRKMDDSVFERIMDPSIRNLDLDGCTVVNDITCRHIARTCEELRRLSLAGCVCVGNEGLIQFAYNCPQLEYLNLTSCNTISNLGIQEISRKCKNLKWICLTGCSKVTDIAITELMLACSQLHTLILRDCNKLTDDAFKHIGKQVLHLDMSGSDLITDNAIVHIANTCKNLQSIKLSSRNITDASITELASKCPMLTTVELNGCDLITDVAIKSISAGCPNLEILTVSCCKNISNEAFEPKKGNRENLTSIDLTRCLNITDVAVKNIVNECPNLESVNLSSCEDITDDAITALANACPRLTEVNLSKCMNVTDNGIIDLANKCGANLSKLVLYNCHKITDKSMMQLALVCPQLREIDISSCQTLTDDAVHALVQGCPYLEVLGLEECKISENAILSIAKYGYSLKTLKLAYCKGLTNDSLDKLSEGCPNISHLDLSNCTQVSIAALKQALGRWPYLKFLSLKGFHQMATEAIEHPSIQELNLSWCKNIQDAAIDQIAIGCPSLITLDLAWAGKITANSVHKLAQKLPTLRFLNLRGCTKVASLTLKYLSGGNIMIYT